MFRVSTWSHQVDENGMRSYLNISSVEVEDGGLYCCSVQSQSSSAQLDHEPKSSMQHCARLNVYGTFPSVSLLVYSVVLFDVIFSHQPK